MFVNFRLGYCFMPLLYSSLSPIVASPPRKTGYIVAFPPIVGFPLLIVKYLSFVEGKWVFSAIKKNIILISGKNKVLKIVPIINDGL